MRIWGIENPHAFVKHERDFSKLKVFYANSCWKVYVLFFTEATLTGATYLEMQDQPLLPQLSKDNDNSASFNRMVPLYHNDVWGHLKDRLCHKDRLAAQLWRSRITALATTISGSPPMWYLEGFHRGSCVCTTACNDAVWPTRTDTATIVEITRGAQFKHF